jgi:hypothetical protein
MHHIHHTHHSVAFQRSMDDDDAGGLGLFVLSTRAPNQMLLMPSTPHA